MAKSRPNRNRTFKTVNAVICRRASHNCRPKNNLRKAAHKLNQIITVYGLTIFVKKTKSMAFKVRTKILIDNKIIEQVNLNI